MLRFLITFAGHSGFPLWYVWVYSWVWPAQSQCVLQQPDGEDYHRRERLRCHGLYLHAWSSQEFFPSQDGSFFSALGGSLSLWLGISFCALFELVEIWTKQCLYLILFFLGRTGVGPCWEYFQQSRCKEDGKRKQSLLNWSKKFKSSIFHVCPGFHYWKLLFVSDKY